MTMQFEMEILAYTVVLNALHLEILAYTVVLNVLHLHIFTYDSYLLTVAKNRIVTTFRHFSHKYCLSMSLN